MRLPFLNWIAFGSIEMSKRYTSPGLSGSAFVCRWEGSISVECFSSKARCDARRQPFVTTWNPGLRPFARSSGDCGYCSESLMTKSVSLAVDDAYSVSLIGPAISRSFSSGGVVKVSTRRAGSQFGGPDGPKPTTPLTQPGLG